LAQLWLQSLKDERDFLAQKRTNQQERLKKLEEDRSEVAALREWEQTTVRWLDELYDLAARMDQREGFRINQLSMNLAQRSDAGPAGAKKGAGKDLFAGQIKLSGVVPADQDGLIGRLP